MNLEKLRETLKSTLDALNENDLLKDHRKIVLNCRGHKYQVCLDTFEKLPNSRLGKLRLALKNKSNSELDTLCDEFSLESNEFFFNKDPQILNLILEFYSNEKVHLNINCSNFCAILLLNEFKYWGIDKYDDLLAPCCKSLIEKQKALVQDDLEQENSILKDLDAKEDFGKCFFPKIRRFIWNIMEYPKSSIFAMVFF